MAESVGKLNLELEVGTDVQEQLNKVGEAFEKAMTGIDFKDVVKTMQDSFTKGIGNISKSIEAMVSNSEKQMNSMLEKMRSMSGIQMPSMDAPTDTTSSSQNAGTTSMPRAPPISMPKIKIDYGIEQQKELIQNAIDQLDLSFNQLIQKEKELRQESQLLEIGLQQFGRLNPVDTARYNELENSLSKIALEMDTITTKGDALRNKLNSIGNVDMASPVEAQTSKVKKVLSSLTDFAKSSFNSMNSKIQSGLVSIGNNFKNGFGKIGDYVKKSMNPLSMLTGKLKDLTTGVGRSGFSFKRLFATLIGAQAVMAIARRAIMSLFSYVGNALNTNNQFANSLNQIKSNLQTAFAPILQAIIPSLNMLMNALATVTSYIANFMSLLFGKSVSASAKAAQGYANAGKAVAGYGKEAKKALQLASFDEIENIQTDDDSSGSGTGGVQIEAPDTSIVDDQMKSLVDKIKDILSQLWEPFKLAWENQGQATIDAIVYAFTELWGLTKEIGKSFLEVWTNGTGQAIIEEYLKGWQQFLLLIGDIAGTFKDAWVEAGVGTSIIQGILDLVYKWYAAITEVWATIRSVWDEKGSDFATGLLTNIDNTMKSLNGFADMLKRVWDNGGKYLFEKLVELGLNLVDLGTTFIPIFIDAFSALEPVFSSICNGLGIVFEVFNSFINWLASDGQPILEGLTNVLIFLGALFVAINAPIVALAGVFLMLLGNWETIVQVFNDTLVFLEEIFMNFITFINESFIIPFQENFIILGGILEGFLFSVNSVWEGIKKVFNGIITFIMGIFTGDWRKAWQGIQDIFKGIFDGFVAIAKTPINLVIGLFNGIINAVNKVIEFINSISFDLPEWMGGGHVGFNIPFAPNVPYLAKGGIVDSPTLAMFGEAGKEAVMPLENNTGWIDDLAGKIAGKIQPQNMNTQQLERIIELLVEILEKSGDVILGDSIVGYIKNALDEEKRKNGNQTFAIDR
ncbi:phage tail protein [Anaerorhabdus sp.]|uniref:phage tail protein n=1 Tax=Anaerorhabdus sp. TaxID=1872524 RepID=UPI002FCB7F4B